MAATRNITIDQGSTYEDICTMAIDAVPVDLTGCTVRAQIRADLSAEDDASEPLAEFTCPITDPTGGVFALRLTAAETAAIPATLPNRLGTVRDPHVYDVELIYADGVTVERLMEGTVTVRPEVTR